MINSISPFLLLFLLGISCSLFAQQENHSTAIVAGFNSSTLNPGRYIDRDYFHLNLGYHVGVSSEWDLGHKFQLNIEALWSSYKFSEKTKRNDAPFPTIEITDFRLKQNFISFPVSINYAINKANIQVGTMIEYLVKVTSDNIPEADMIRNLEFNNKVNFGLLYGGHYDFYNLEIGLRKFIGLANLADIEITDDAFVEKISLYNSSSLQFYIKYHL